MSYAYYRLPYADSYTVVEMETEPLVLSSMEEIGGREGFVIAPFRVSKDAPIVLLRPDRLTTVTMKPLGIDEPTAVTDGGATVPSEEYAAAFSAFHTSVSRGEFRKLVLARKKEAMLCCPSAAGQYEKLFLRTCAMYPRLMVMLFSTPQTGTWIVASPEILVEGQGDTYHTVALAGTMPYREGYLDWSEKNKGEQHVVEQYIHDTLRPLCDDILTDGPVTTRAANLVHLRTDFRFHLNRETTLGQLVGRLHPTPAVCGLPKQQARDFILRNERMDRRYYSGFAGPVGIAGDTHLFVSLRCAELHDDRMTLYAGGGIMPDSQCEAEWAETEAKMQTIEKARMAIT